MLPLRGLHVKQLRIWAPATQHLLWNQGKPRKTFIELAINPYLCFSFFFSFKNIYKLFLQTFLSEYNLDKHQTVYNTC
jgi:hypothetical protein